MRLGAALGLIGQIDVLEPRLGVGLHDRLLERRVELALLPDRIEDRLAAIIELPEIAQAFVERAQLCVVEASRGLLAITRDEGNGGAFVEKGDGGGDLLRPRTELGGELPTEAANQPPSSQEAFGLVAAVIVLLLAFACVAVRDPAAIPSFLRTPEIGLIGAFLAYTLCVNLTFATAYQNPEPLRHSAYYLQVLRGVIVKGVGVSVLWPQGLALTVFAVVTLAISMARFRKTIE